jgi:23S rRNA (pseudouridine1915-N3)-methyltransferase
MLRIKVIVVDRTREGFIREGVSLYLDRVRHYAPIEWLEVKPAKSPKGRPEEDILAEESANLLKRVSPRDYTVSLDRTGKTRTSEELARWLETLTQKGTECAAFLIGGPLGLSKEAISGSREVLSLSSMTLTHEMARLVLLEQLYRAFTILKGEKYHK